METAAAAAAAVIKAFEFVLSAVFLVKIRKLFDCVDFDFVFDFVDVDVADDDVEAVE